MREKTYLIKIISLPLLLDDDPDTAGDPTSPKSHEQRESHTR